MAGARSRYRKGLNHFTSLTQQIVLLQAEHALVLGAAAFKEVNELSILLPELALLDLHLLCLRKQLRFIYFFELTCLWLQLVYD
jgi:hypothetical protein